jgi:hypothetical protein
MLTIRKMRKGELARFKKLEGEYHYMGETRSGGDTLRLVAEEDGGWVALMVWGSACYRLKDRDAHIGWTASLRASRQKLVVQNRRFTLLAERGGRPNLASQVLGLAARELPALWRASFGYEPLLAETFCDREASAGTCYRAAGWTPLGMTKGFSRSRQTADYYVPNGRPKALWVRPLRPGACEALRSAGLPPGCRRGAGSDAYGVLPLPEPLVESLHDALCRVRDPRGSNRTFHIGAMLTLLVLGVMAGHRDLKPIVRHCGKLTQRQRVALGLPRFDRGGGGDYRKTPGYTALYSLLRQLDPDGFADVLGAWVRAHEGGLPRQLALDGKFIRDVVGLVSLADAETGVPVAMAAASQKEGEGGRCELAAGRGLVRALDLSGALVSADALHCQQETVREVTLSGGEALVQVKGNQKKILAACKGVAAGRPPLFAPAP